MSADFKTQLQAIIQKSLQELSPSQNNLPAATLEVPNDRAHGEFSCNIALRLGRILKEDPLAIATKLQNLIEKNIAVNSVQSSIKTIEVKKPGFINFFLTTQAICEVLVTVLHQSKDYGRANIGQNERVQIEFVSANPTGPLSVAHARQAAVGDALVNIMRCVGFDVKKEFYVNDEGNQINILGRSIEQRAREALGETVAFAEDNYQGDYIRDMAREFLDKQKIKITDALNTLKAKDPHIFAKYGVDYLLAVIKQELKDFGVEFDAWSYQSKIATVKAVEAALELLHKKGFVYEKDGALWFLSTTFGDDKDRVMRKSDGSYTYLTPDIVYHKNKFDRGFTKLINIWGPDHHGYIPRLKAAVSALGKNPENLEIIIVQLATIFRAGKPLSMSTRRGQYISLREVIDEVGVDAARFFFLLRRVEAHLDFDLELAKKQTPENPVYYIQYAHARINSVIGFAGESKLKPKGSDLKLLTQPEECDLIKAIGRFPDVLLVCAGQRDPFTLANYLLELAIFFHKFYDRHRVVSDNQELSSERLTLIEAARIVLANGLRLLGISAPVKM